MRSPLSVPAILVLAVLALCGGVVAALRSASRASEEALVVPPPAPVSGPRETLIPTGISFAPLEEDGVAGGRATTTLPGTPAQILAAILDFEHAAEHRTFARKLEVLSRTADQVEAALTLKGKLGIHPTIHVRYTTTRTGADRSLTYKLTQKAFGIARYFGGYRIEGLPGVPPRSRFTSTIFLSSGIPLASIGREEIEAGQRRDQTELRTWMRQRLAATR